MNRSIPHRDGPARIAERAGLPLVQHAQDGPNRRIRGDGGTTGRHGRRPIQPDRPMTGRPLWRAKNMGLSSRRRRSPGRSRKLPCKCRLTRRTWRARTGRPADETESVNVRDDPTGRDRTSRPRCVQRRVSTGVHRRRLRLGVYDVGRCRLGRREPFRVLWAIPEQTPDHEDCRTGLDACPESRPRQQPNVVLHPSLAMMATVVMISD